MAPQPSDIMYASYLASLSWNSDDPTLYESDDDETGPSATFMRDWNSLPPYVPMNTTKPDDESWDSASLEIEDMPRLYNVGNVVTSDIVVRFDGGRSEFLSEKRILSSMSGYFKQAFSSNFPVATSDVIDLGDEDDAKQVYAMLCFIHGTSYTKIHQRNAVGRNLDFHIDLYLLGEQFDISTLRYAAATTFFKEALFFINTPWFPSVVARIIGPDAPVFVDQFLVEITIKICTEQIQTLVTNEHFVEMAHSGELADEGMMVKLYLALGQRIRDMSGHSAWQSNEQRLSEAQTNMLTAEAAMGPGPFDRSTLAGQIMAARAQNAAWNALTNLALLVPQPTWAPPPAILAMQPPAAIPGAANPLPHVSHPVVTHTKTSLFKTIRTRASQLKKVLSSPFKKTPSA